MNIKDYLHYYMGQPCTVIRNDGKTVEDIICFSVLQEIGIPGKLPEQYYTAKPHLRRLGDMTKEEFDAVKEQLSHDIAIAHALPPTFYDKPWHVLILENRLQTNTLRFNDGLVLLKQGFDLWGLIDAGLAVDAKQQKEG